MTLHAGAKAAQVLLIAGYGDRRAAPDRAAIRGGAAATFHSIQRIPIPLRAPDPDARLKLKQVLDRVYESAGYEDYLYRRLPQPPLNDAA